MNLLHILLFKNSRKMGLAIWLFIVANVYLWLKLINSGEWMNVILLVTALCGGGTIADKWFENKKTPPTP